jgi:hypothetical protein
MTSPADGSSIKAFCIAQTLIIEIFIAQSLESRKFDEQRTHGLTIRRLRIIGKRVDMTLAYKALFAWQPLLKQGINCGTSSVAVLRT